MDIDVLRMMSHVKSCNTTLLGEWIVADRDRFDRAMGHLVMQERS